MKDNGHALDDIERPPLGLVRLLVGPDAIGLGSAFVAEARHALAERPGGPFTTPAVDIEAAVTTVPPGAALPPGVVLPPAATFPFDSVAGRFAPGTATAGAVPFLRETARALAATYVGVGVAKPESALEFTPGSQPLVKLAHWLPVRDELLDDAPALASYLDAFLGVGVLDVLDNQLVNGDGAAGHLMGLIALPGKTANVVATAGTGLAAILTAAANLWTASKRRPDTVVINPASYNLVAPPDVRAPGEAYPLAWVLTPYMPVGQAIVGAFAQGAMLFSRGGVAIQATNSHADMFARNITAIRAEIRVLAVHFVPAAFCLVTGVAAADARGPA